MLISTTIISMLENYKMVGSVMVLHGLHNAITNIDDEIVYNNKETENS